MSQSDSSIIKVGLGEIEHKRFPLTPVSETKTVHIEESTFEGFSAGIGNVDHGNDMLMPGSFSKSIQERVQSSRVKLLDQHRTDSTNRVLGKVIDAAERQTSPKERKALAERLGVDVDETPTHRLWSKFFVSSKQAGRDALTDIDEGILDGLSIGYRPVRIEYVLKDGAEEDDDPELAWLLGQGVRKLHEVAWWETSLVIWGMNSAALVIPDSVKATLDKVAELTNAEDAQASEKQVRYAIRALENLLGDEQEAEMRIKRGEFDELVQKVTEITDTLANLDLTKSAVQAAEELEEKAEEVIDGLDAVDDDDKITVHFGAALNAVKNARDKLDELAEIMTEAEEDPDTKEEATETEEAETEEKEIEAEGHDSDEETVEEKEDAGDTDTEAKEIDESSDADADGHSDEHFEETEEVKDEKSFDPDSVLAKLDLIEIANREG